LYETVRDLGYDVWWHAVPLYRPDNFAANGENIFENIYSFSLLCCHSTKPVDTTGLKKLESIDDHPMLQNAR